MVTVATLVAKPSNKNQFCHLFTHMVLMPNSESKSDLKQLRYIRNKIYNGYSGAPVAKLKTRNQFYHLYSHMVPMSHSE